MLNLVGVSSFSIVFEFLLILLFLLIREYFLRRLLLQDLFCLFRFPYNLERN